MSNVLDRINNQIKEGIVRNLIVKSNQEPVINPPKIEVSPPLSLVELKNLLMEEIELTLEPQNEPIKVIDFNGVEEFVVWYLTNQVKFNDGQKKALNTLIQARDMINTGCGCRRASRLRQANEYYKVFWLNNSKTDLPKNILEVGGFEKIIFSIDGNPVLVYPSPTPKKSE